MRVIHGIVKMPYGVKPYMVIVSEAGNETQTSECGSFNTLPEACEKLTDVIYHGNSTPPFLNQARRLKGFVKRFVNASQDLGATDSNLYKEAVAILEQDDMDFR